MNVAKPHRKATESTYRPSVKVVRAEPDEHHVDNGRPAHLDLCSTCVHAATCGFPRNGDGPVHYCEEFDIEPTGPALAAAPSEELVHEDTTTDRESYPGICSTCEKRDTCTFPKPEGGVWQCEEFE